MRKFLPKLLLCNALFFLLGFTLVYNQIGDRVPGFALRNVDGKVVSLSDYKGAKGFILVFTCNHCPYARAYETRLAELNKKYKPLGFPVIAINSNDAKQEETDSYKAMIVHAREKNFSYPYLYDSTQAVAKSYNARKTPQAFVLSADAGHYTLKYSGAIDDNAGEPGKVKLSYVEDAVNAILSNKPVGITHTNLVGCDIKWASLKKK